jgi:exodeoxyribonuclease V alpha subunit
VQVSSTNDHLEKLSGVVERITYHNEQNGWSVLKVSPFREPNRLATVLIHQAQVFAGATMEFWGTWSHHPKHGEQFKAERSVEKKPASAAALEKYLGSGLIVGVGPATAKKIVGYFKEQTLTVFEESIEDLMSVPGIAGKKLEKIKVSWDEHRSIRDVMMFLQSYGISTLFSTKIFKTYGPEAIAIVSKNPYRLAHDIYGIGFFSADKIALAMGFLADGEPRIRAGIKHVLAASRDEGHCFLTTRQIITNTLELLKEAIDPERLSAVLKALLSENEVRVRRLNVEGDETEDCFYSKGLYYDELKVADTVRTFLGKSMERDRERIQSWVSRYCKKSGIQLSDEQYAAVCSIPGQSFSVLTGGPGCGKTTCTEVLVKLLKAMQLNVTLAAPTGRAAQRMTEVIGLEAKTIHRLLEWAPSKAGFNFDEETPIQTDFLILDEVSMLDITLAAAVLKAVPKSAQILLIGDPDQLPAVGAGNVLSDLLGAEDVPRFVLTEVFRQAKASSIIRFAHEINAGTVPQITSPIQAPDAFQRGVDCLFVDADEATREQVKFIQRVHNTVGQLKEGQEGYLLKLKEEWAGRIEKVGEEVAVDRLYRPEAVSESEIRAPILSIPDKFNHVDLLTLARAESEVDQLLSVLKRVHPWSSLKYGLTALETAIRFYTKTIPTWFGRSVEIQLLSPQVRGTLGTMNLNQSLQQISNPESPNKRQIKIGDKILREGDRVIQTRNNYTLGIFNGDIGKVVSVDVTNMTLEVLFSGGGERLIAYKKEDLSELQLAYGITIHKSQGSEFEVVIIPILGQHYNMLFRNLIYTGLTRAKKLAIFIGTRKAFTMAVRQIDNRKRQTALAELVQAPGSGKRNRSRSSEALVR